MVVKRPKAVMTGDPAVDKAIISTRAAIPSTAVIEGLRQLDGVSLVGGVTKRVAHGLGRKVRGWLVVRQNAGAALGYIYDELDTHTDTDTYLYLRAEGFSPTVSILVF